MYTCRPTMSIYNVYIIKLRVFFRLCVVHLKVKREKRTRCNFRHACPKLEIQE